MIPRGPLKMIQPRGITIKNSCNSLRGPIGGSRRDKPHRKIRAFTIHGPVKEEYGFLVEIFARFAIESTFAPPIDGLVMEKNGFLAETSPRFVSAASPNQLSLALFYERIFELWKKIVHYQ